MEETNVSRFVYDRFNDNFDEVIELGFTREFVRCVVACSPSLISVMQMMCICIIRS